MTSYLTAMQHPLTRWQPWRSQLRRRSFTEQFVKQSPTVEQSLVLSTAALGMVAGSAVVPPLAVLSLPLSIAVFMPSLKLAYYSIRDERRITNPVLTATRIGVYVVMGFYTIAALDAFLQSISQRWAWQAERDLDRTLDNAELSAAVRERVWQAAQEISATHERGAFSADCMAPFMFAGFFATLPFYGANRSAAFLMTSFGAHMNTLSPMTVRDYVKQSLEQGIAVLDIAALELLSEADTLVLDVDASALRLDGLREQFVRVVEVVGVESAEKIATIHQLQQDGRTVVYLGCDVNGIREADIAVMVGKSADVNAHALLLTDDALNALSHILSNSDSFNSKQQFNFKTPIAFDIADITTTVVIHFGLFYSVLFNYSGLLVSMANEKLRQRGGTDNTDRLTAFSQ